MGWPLVRCSGPDPSLDLSLDTDERSMEQRIVLRTTQRELIALYERRGTIDPFRSPHTKFYRRTFLWAVGAAALMVIVAALWEQAAWLVVWAAIIVVGATALLLYAFAHTLKARSSVFRWAKEAEDAQESVLLLYDQGFTLHYRGSEYITKWEAVKRVELHEDHVIIKANDERLFPKTSMTSEEYTQLCDHLRTKVLDASPVVTEV